MNRLFFKTLSMALAVTIAAVLLAACGGASAASPTSSDSMKLSDATTETTAAKPTTKAAAATTEPRPLVTIPRADLEGLPFVSITHYAIGDPNSNGMLEKVQAEWNKLLKKELNCELIQMWIPRANYLKIYNLLLASGDDSFDLIEASSTRLELWQNAYRGAWMALDDLLPKYAPVSWNDIPKGEWDECRLDGKIICIPENSYTQYINQGFIYRGDWAEAAGLPKQLTDLDQFEKYCDWILANKPGVYPIDVDGRFDLFSRWAEIHTPTVSIVGVNETVRGASLDEPNVAVDIAFDDVALIWAQDMKKWGDKGYWRENVLNKASPVAESFKAGTSGVVPDDLNAFSDLKWQMENVYFPGEAEIFMLLYGDLAGRLVREPVHTHGAMCVYAKSKNPERALMVYDFIRNDERMYRLFNWGIEGVNYIIDPEGYRARPKGWTQEEHAWDAGFVSGRLDKYDKPSRQEWDGIRDYWKTIDKRLKPDPYANFALNGSSIEAEASELNAVIAAMTPALSTGKAGEPAEAIEKYRSELKKAGYDKYFAEVKRQLAAFK